MTEVVDSVDAAVSEWLTVPDVAQRLGVEVTRVRQMLRERQLLARRRGDRQVLQIPAEFLDGREVVKGLPGTLVVLHDSGFDDEAALRWLFAEDETLPGSPIGALRANRGTEVRRRAQALAF